MPVLLNLLPTRSNRQPHDVNRNTNAAQERGGAPTELPPDGGYGWICTACCFTVNCFTWGVVSVSLSATVSQPYQELMFKSYGVFLSYYLSSEIFAGSRPSDFALIGGLNFGVAMLASPFVTISCRTWGLQVPMYAGSLFLGSGFIAASYATLIWQLYLSQGVLVGLGVGFVYIPTIPVLSQWFDKRRSLANGITAAGSGVGGLIFSLTTGAMINNLGHEWALRLIGIIVLVSNILSTSFVRDRNAIVHSVQHAFDTALLMRWDVFFLLMWAFISMLGYITLLYSLSDFARSIGLSTEQGTQITALLNLGTALGRPFIGIASDKYGRFEVASGLTLFCGLCCVVIWIPASNFGVTVLFGIISGAILGVFWVVSRREILFVDLLLTYYCRRLDHCALR